MHQKVYRSTIVISTHTVYIYIYITKIRIFNTNVKSVLLYGCETWKLTKTIIYQLQFLVNRLFQYSASAEY